MKNGLLFLFITLFTSAEGQFLQDRVSGKYYFHVQSGEVKGSPFLYDDWRYSFITYANGLQLKNLKLKFDMLNNKPLFLRNDSAFEFVQELWSFIIYNPEGDSVIYKNGFEGETITSEIFLQVLQEGKIILLKHQGKAKTESKGFGVGITTTEFTTKPPAFYITKKTALIKIKKTEDLAALMGGRDWQLVADYISKKKLNLKKEEDIINVINYYNTL